MTQSNTLLLADELDEYADRITKYTNNTGDGLCRAAATELRALHVRNAELLEACKAIVAWDDAENDAPDYASDNGAHWRMRQALCEDAFNKARAAIAKAEGEAV